jgi:putative transposase
MFFEKGYIYHIYNQGNNRRRIFFKRDNYLYFLRKIKTYVVPYTDILAWCLMPNHFHLMVLVNELTVDVVSNQRTVGVAQSHADSRERSFNDSIGIMLRSYTQAINKQNNTSGKLIREKTKAECVNCYSGITPTFISGNIISTFNDKNPEQQYPQVCFDYIHQNPIKAGLVKNSIDWEFSSAKDYAGLRNGKLINRKVAGEYVVFIG